MKRGTIIRETLTLQQDLLNGLKNIRVRSLGWGLGSTYIIVAALDVRQNSLAQVQRKTTLCDAQSGIYYPLLDHGDQWRSIARRGPD